MDELINRGIIEANSGFKYQVGVCSKSYRITEGFSGPCIRITIVARTVAAALAKRQKKQLEEREKAQGVQSYIESVLNRLSFAPEVEDLLNEWQFLSFDQGACWLLAYDSVIEKHWFFAEDKKTGRIFNNVTSMPSVLRSHLLIDGKPLVELDIKNAQPLFMASLYPNGSTEKARFVAVVESGAFYETLQKQSGKTSMARDDFKRSIFTNIIFGNRCFDKQLELAFISLFPELWSIINRLKIPDYTQFAIKLQKIEAQCIINGVLGEVIASNNPLSVLTVHDAILTTQDGVDLIAALIKKHVVASCGVVPAVSVKRYHGGRAAA